MFYGLLKGLIEETRVINRTYSLIYPEIRYLIEGFVGRQKIISRIKNIEEGVILLEGDLGVGKTTIAARLAIEKRVPCILIGFPYPSEFAEGPSVTEEIILNEIVKQINYYYKAHIIFSESDLSHTINEIRNSFEIIYKELGEKPFIIVDGIDEAKDPENILSLLRRITTTDMKLLITFRTGSLSKVTLGRIKRLLRLARINVEHIKLIADKNDADIEKFIEIQLEELSKQNIIPKERIDDSLKARLKKLFSGRFIIATTFFKFLKKNPSVLDDFEKIPVITEDLKEYYDCILSRIDNDLVNEVLTFLAIAKGSIDKNLLSAYIHYKFFSDKSLLYAVKKVEDTIETIKPLIKEINNKIVLFHSSLAEYIVRYKIKIEKEYVHQSIADFLTSVTSKKYKNELVKKAIEDYKKRRLIYHLYNAGNYEEVIDTLINLEKRKLVTAKDKKILIENLLMGIKASYNILKRDNISEKTITSFLENIFYFSKMISELSLPKLQIPIKLIQLLTKLEMIEQAFFYLETNYSIDQKTKFIEALIQSITKKHVNKHYKDIMKHIISIPISLGKQKITLLTQFLKKTEALFQRKEIISYIENTVEKIEDEKNKLEALIELLELLVDGKLTENEQKIITSLIFNEIEYIQEDSYKSKFLVSLFYVFEKQVKNEGMNEKFLKFMLDITLKIARNMKDSMYLVDILNEFINIIEKYELPNIEKIISQIYERINSINDPFYKAKTLITFLKLFDKVPIKNIKNMIDEISLFSKNLSNYSSKETLEKIKYAYFHSKENKEKIAIRKSIESAAPLYLDYLKIEILSALSKYYRLIDETKSRELKNIISKFTRNIQDPYYRAKILSSILIKDSRQDSDANIEKEIKTILSLAEKIKNPFYSADILTDVEEILIKINAINEVNKIIDDIIKMMPKISNDENKATIIKELLHPLIKNKVQILSSTIHAVLNASESIPNEYHRAEAISMTLSTINLLNHKKEREKIIEKSLKICTRITGDFEKTRVLVKIIESLIFIDIDKIKKYIENVLLLTDSIVEDRYQAQILDKIAELLIQIDIDNEVIVLNRLIDLSINISSNRKTIQILKHVITAATLLPERYSESLLDKVQKISKNITDPYYRAKLMLILSRNYSKHRIKKIVSLLRKAYDISKKVRNTQKRIELLLDVGEVYSLFNKSKAEDILEETLKIAIESTSESSKANILIQLIHAVETMETTELEKILMTIEHFAYTLLKEEYYRGKVLIEMATVYSTFNLQKADALLRETIRLARGIEEKQFMFELLCDITSKYFQINYSDIAFEILEEIIADIPKIINDYTEKFVFKKILEILDNVTTNQHRIIKIINKLVDLLHVISDEDYKANVIQHFLNIFENRIFNDSYLEKYYYKFIEISREFVDPKVKIKILEAIVKSSLTLEYTNLDKVLENILSEVHKLDNNFYRVDCLSRITELLIIHKQEDKAKIVIDQALKFALSFNTDDEKLFVIKELIPSIRKFNDVSSIKGYVEQLYDIAKMIIDRYKKIHAYIIITNALLLFDNAEAKRMLQEYEKSIYNDLTHENKKYYVLPLLELADGFSYFDGEKAKRIIEKILGYLDSFENSEIEETIIEKIVTIIKHLDTNKKCPLILIILDKVSKIEKERTIARILEKILLSLNDLGITKDDKEDIINYILNVVYNFRSSKLKSEIVLKIARVTINLKSKNLLRKLIKSVENIDNFETKFKVYTLYYGHKALNQSDLVKFVNEDKIVDFLCSVSEKIKLTRYLTLLSKVLYRRVFSLDALYSMLGCSLSQIISEYPQAIKTLYIISDNIS